MAQGAAADSAAADSAAAEGAAAEGAAAEGAAPGMAGFPMMGAGPAQPERDRKRHAWLDEDADIWGRRAGLVPPLVEG
jgi:hypothetical protein